MNYPAVALINGYFYLFESGPTVSPGWPGTHYVQQVGLKLVTLLPLCPDCWDSRVCHCVWCNIPLCEYTSVCPLIFWWKCNIYGYISLLFSPGKIRDKCLALLTLCVLTLVLITEPRDSCGLNTCNTSELCSIPSSQLFTIACSRLLFFMLHAELISATYRLLHANSSLELQLGFRKPPDLCVHSSGTTKKLLHTV